MAVSGWGWPGSWPGSPRSARSRLGWRRAPFGIVFAGVAAVTVQLSSTTRGASGFAAAVLGLAFVVGGVGNMLGHVDATGLRLVSAWPAWLSPLGWGQQMRPFGGDHWWPLALFASRSSFSSAGRPRSPTRRDVGRGILAERRGTPRRAAPQPVRARLAPASGAPCSAGRSRWRVRPRVRRISDEIEGPAGATADWYARMGGSDQILDAYRASVIEMAGMAVAIYPVQILLRMRAEEADGRLESILAASVSRPRWMISHLLNAGLGALLCSSSSR